MIGHQRPYFIGLALPPELSERVFSYKRHLHEGIDHTLKPLVPHVTLLHPSSLRFSPPEELLPRIRQISSSYVPLTLSLSTVDVFDRAVLYIRAASPALEPLHTELVNLLPEASRKTYQTRPYTPHVTLVQLRAPYVLDTGIVREQTGTSLDLPYRFTVESLTCFTQIRPREYLPEPI